MENPFQVLQQELSEVKKLLNTVLKNTTPKAEPFAELPENLTRKQTAKILDVNLNTVDNWTREGKIVKHYLGSAVRFKKSEVLTAFHSLEKYKRRATAA
jgi:excisionase family DNA binding protein